MKGASQPSLSQPLAALAPKTASGGKIRARRFAPAWSADKPLYRFGKTRQRAQTRVGARILANTIGNLAAEKLASIGQGGGDPTNLLAGTPFDGDGQLALSGGGGAGGSYLADGSVGYAGAPLLSNGLMSQNFAPGLGVDRLPVLQGGEVGEIIVTAPMTAAEARDTIIVTAPMTAAEAREADRLAALGRGAKELGSLSARYETSGRGVSTVSTGIGRGGRPDPGGVSYGSYQLTSQTPLRINGKTVIVYDGGNVAIFLENEGAPWASKFGTLAPGSKTFSDIWRKIAASDPLGLHAAEHEFIKRTHYDPAAERIQAATGVDINTLPAAVQDVLWSTAVQHGAGFAPYTNKKGNLVQGKGATVIFIDAMNQTRGSSNYSERLISNVYARRTTYWPSDAARYQSEQLRALQMIKGN